MEKIEIRGGKPRTIKNQPKPLYLVLKLLYFCNLSSVSAVKFAHRYAKYNCGHPYEILNNMTLKEYRQHDDWRWYQKNYQKL